MLYVGLDAHKATSQVTVMDSGGNVLRRKRIVSTPMAVRQALAGYDEPLKAVLEASYCWAPMYDWLDEVADEVVLAHPLKVRAIAEARIKTDKIDSETLAHLLRSDLIPRAHASSQDVRARRRVLRQRMFLIRLQTMVKNRIRALLVQHMSEQPRVSDLFGKYGRDWLRRVQLPDPDGLLLKEDLELLEFLQHEISKTNRLIAELAQGDKAVQFLASVPGIGVFLSVLIRWEVDIIERFRQAKKFASYTGLVPSTYASGNRIVHGRLTKQGNKWLRWAFVEAVSPAVRSSACLHSFYQRIKLRRGVKDARIATARKIAELVWTVWTERRCYQERLPKSLRTATEER
jgi:transposase